MSKTTTTTMFSDKGGAVEMAVALAAAEMVQA